MAFRPSGGPRAAFVGCALLNAGLGVFGCQRPPERRRRSRVELNQGGAQRVEARGAGEPVLLDGAADRRTTACSASVRGPVAADKGAVLSMVRVGSDS
jgi:hypothetical protein